MKKSTYKKTIHVDGVVISQDSLIKSTDWVKTIYSSITGISNPVVEFKVKFFDEIGVKACSIEELKDVFNLSKTAFSWIEIQINEDGYVLNSLTIDNDGRVAFESYIDEDQHSLIDRSFRSYVSELDRLMYQPVFRNISSALSYFLVIFGVLCLILSIINFKESSDLEDRVISVVGIEPISESQSLELYANAIKSNDINVKLDAILKSKFASYTKVSKGDIRKKRDNAIQLGKTGGVSILFWIILLFIDKYLFPLFVIKFGRFERNYSTRLYIRGILFGVILLGVVVNLLSDKIKL